MARPSKPFFWEARQEWYCTINGKRHRLGPDKKAAEKAFHGLMAETTSAKPKQVAADTVAAVFVEFLEWTSKNRAPKTYRGYVDYCQSFVDEFPGMTVADLTPQHVTLWIQKHKKWNSTSQFNAISCLKRAFHWAEHNFHTPNPIREMEKPTPLTRTDDVSLKEFKTILRNLPNRNLREMLLFCWDVGCRPQEAKQLESRHIDLANRRCVLPTMESKGQKAPRVIYLATERSVRLVQRGMHQARIFLNSQGRPWTAAAVKCAFARLEEKVGKRYTQYSFRHSWITRKLKAGVDSHVVAKLAGHTNSEMIDKVYSHVAKDNGFLLAEAGR